MYGITDNEFIEKYTTDPLYKKIVGELTTRGKDTTTGKKLALTPKILRDFLFYVSMGADLKDAAKSVNLEEKPRQDYNRRSETFSGVTSLAKNNVSTRAKMAVAQAIMGRKPSYYKLTHPVTKQPTYIELREIQPDVKAAMWWLETVDKIGTADSNNDPYKNPGLGSPRNAEEAALLEGLMNSHYDYVKKKEELARQGKSALNLT